MTKADTVDWAKYKMSVRVAFSGYAGSTTLENFPVLVRVSASNGFYYSQFKVADGGDLRFSDATGNLLAHEIDTWNPSGESLVWVKVPSFNASTVITAHYGCANPDAVTFTASDVWANGYTAVWHLNESGRFMLDSSLGEDDDSNKLRDALNDGTILRGQPGLVGKAVEFDHIANNANELFHYGSLVTYSQRYRLVGSEAFTVEVWTYQDDHEPGANTRDGYMFKEVRYNAWKETFSMCEIKNDYGRNGLTYVRGYLDDTSNVSAGYENYASLPRPARAEWNYNVARYGSSVLEGIVNCAQKGSCSFTMPSPPETTYLILGNSGVEAGGSGICA